MIESGILGQLILTANTWATLVRIPEDQYAAPTLTVRILNHDQANGCTVRFYACPPAYLDGQDPTLLRAILPADKPILAGGMSEDTGIVIGPGWALVVWSSLVGVGAVAWGHTR